VQLELTPLLHKRESQFSQKPHTKGYYDRILRNLLTAVRTSITRDEFLDGIKIAFEGSEDERSASYVVFVEGYRDPENDSLSDVTIRNVVGGHPRQLENLSSGFKDRGLKSRLINTVLIEHQNIDFLLSLNTEESAYDGEFQELHGKGKIWLSAVALPSMGRGQPERAIFAIYPVREHGFKYKFPRGGHQEWALLEALPDVYAMLNKQLSTVAEQVAEERHNLIMELAPTAINHEIGTGLSLILDGIHRGTYSLRELNKKIGKDKNFDNLVSELVIIKRQALRARKITDAFNNIEKRNPGAVVSVRQLVDETTLILEHLLKKYEIELEISKIPDIDIRTDAALVEHVILNVLHNAIDAIADEQERSEHDSRHIWIEAREMPDDMVNILILNDGPPIPSDMRMRLFQKGVTSKPHGFGHGHGLYICRLVANHLGGNFDLCHTKNNNTPENVCFSLIFPRAKHITEDMLTT